MTKDLIFQAPPGHGLLIHTDSNNHDDDDHDDSFLLLTFVPDAPLKSIHPHAHVPASTTDAHLLKGGGSGATVFSGTIPKNTYGLGGGGDGGVVMKHGGPKETAEHVALATIEHELRVRAEYNSTIRLAAADTIDPKEAAEFFRTRIPNFRFIYISPEHCRDRGAELWSTLRNLFLTYKTMKLAGWWESLEGKNVDTNLVLVGKKTERLVRIFRCSNGENEVGEGEEEEEGGGPKVVISNGYVDLLLGPDAELLSSPTDLTPVTLRFGRRTKGYNNLYALSLHLRRIQRERMWKFTQGQSMIGGPSPRTASSLLVKGHLNADGGRLLTLLTDEFIHCIRNLQTLTMPNERNAIDDVEKELVLLKTVLADTNGAIKACTAAAVSKTTDMFVGFAIRKNYHPTDGRFVRLKKAGERFRACFDTSFSEVDDINSDEKKGADDEKRYTLKEEERTPAFFLGKLLEKGVYLQNVFASAPADKPLMSQTALDIVTEDGSWLDLICRAVSVESDSARNCLWNGGLADAGCEF